MRMKLLFASLLAVCPAVCVQAEAGNHSGPGEIVGQELEARAAIVKALKGSEIGADKEIEVAALELNPTWLGYLYTFKARIKATGFAGPEFAQEYEVIGVYNVAAKEANIQEQKPLERESDALSACEAGMPADAARPVVEAAISRYDPCLQEVARKHNVNMQVSEKWMEKDVISVYITPKGGHDADGIKRKGAAKSEVLWKAAGLAGLFDGTQTTGVGVFAAEDQAPAEVKAQPLTRVLVGVYVPVLTEGAEKTLENRVGELVRKYGFVWDSGYKPVVMNDSRERKPIWQGSFTYLVRGWINEERMGEMMEDPLVKGVWPDGRIGAASGEPGAQGGMGPFGPPRDRDVFKEVEACHTADVKFIKRPSMEEALKMLGPCVEALSQRYGLSVRAERRRAGGIPDPTFADGIAIVIEGEASTNRAAEEVELTLRKRQERLLTYRAEVIDSIRLRTSSLQSVVDACVQRVSVGKPENGIVLRSAPPVRDAADFVEVYRGCLEGAREMKIAGLYDGKVRGRNRVMLISNADRTATEAMNGKVTVAGEQGPLEIEVRASKALRYQSR